MKRFFIILALTTAFLGTCTSIISATALTPSSAKAELTELYKRYDDSDYQPENWEILTQAYKEGLLAIDNSASEEEIISNMNIAAEKMIEAEHRGGSVEICITAEKLTLQKGFIIFPELYRTAKYERVSQVTADFLSDKFNNKTRTPFKSTGKIEHNFNLTGIYEEFVDTGDDEYDEIKVPSYLKNYVGTSLPQRSDKGYIRAGDYTPDSCFVLSLNNKFPNISASGIPVLEEDVIRWQFSIYGKGADVGSTAYGAENPIEKFADKDELIYEFAKLYKLNDMELLLSDENNLKKHNDVLQVLEIATISQTAVKKALDKLETIVPSSKITPKPTKKPTAEKPSQPDNDSSDEKETLSTPTPEAIPVPDNGSDIPDSSASPVPEFNDVPQSHFAYEHIKYLTSQGIISGRNQNTFDPAGTVTRAEFSAMLSRSDSSTPHHTSVSPFIDVPENAWYKDSVIYTYIAGITNGTSDNTFSPDNFITREDIATMLFRYCTATESEISLESDELTFEDSSSISDYAVNPIGAMKKLGIINGKENNKFDPKGFATRAETAKMLSALLQMIYK